jgi:two-component system, OmpR family, response regulator QseB
VSSRILIVEDDLDLGDGLVQALGTHGLAVVWVRSTRDGREFLRSQPTDVLLLDLQLPDGEGLTLLTELRAAQSNVAVIVISARDALASRTEALDQGADDYLIKPFEIPELVSRIHAVLRRVKGQASALWRIGPLVIDTHKRVVEHADGRIIELPRREFDLLVELVGNAGRVLTREQLESRLYREHEAVQSNALEVHIHGLRKKLGDALIKTVRGVGYLLDSGS